MRSDVCLIVKKVQQDLANITTRLIGFMTIGYCVKCRDKREIGSPAPYTMKNGKPAIKGTCPTCSTAIFRIGRG